MRYIHYEWIHDHPEEPVDFFSEVDEDGSEVRKVEIHRDGRADFASGSESGGGAGLSIESFPPVAKINEDPEFRAEEITEAEFEKVWNSARSAIQPR